MSLQPDRVRELHFVIVGKSGVGKTSLASALLTNESGKVSYPGTEDFLVVCKQGRLEGIPVHVYDTRGIGDGSVSCEKVMEAIKRNCPVDQLNAVIVCLRWDERLDETSKDLFHCLNKLDPNIWSNTVFALTFCDHLPPGLKCKSDAEKRGVVNQKWYEWENAIKQQLSSLGVSHSVIHSIRMAPTTHTHEDIDEECFLNIIQPPWLEYLWQIIRNRNIPFRKPNNIPSGNKSANQLRHWVLVFGIGAVTMIGTIMYRLYYSYYR